MHKQLHSSDALLFIAGPGTPHAAILCLPTKLARLQCVLQAVVSRNTFQHTAIAAAQFCSAVRLVCKLYSFSGPQVGHIVHIVTRQFMLHAGRSTVHWNLCLLHAVPCACLYHQGEDICRRKRGTGRRASGHLCGELIWFWGTSCRRAPAAACPHVPPGPLTV